MKNKIFFALTALLFSITSFAQVTNKIQADSVKIFQVGNHPAELIIENASRNKTGAVLKNSNNGRTTFDYVVDSTWVIDSILFVKRGPVTSQYLIRSSGTVGSVDLKTRYSITKGTNDSAQFVNDTSVANNTTPLAYQILQGRRGYYPVKGDTSDISGIVKAGAFQNIDSLRNSNLYTKGLKRVWTQGYYSPGDGGGATYKWNAGSSAADDSSFTIKPIGYSGSGRWELIPQDNTYNFLALGAKGDNSFDNWWTWTKLHNKMSINKSATLFIPSGDYLFSKTIEQTKPFSVAGDNSTILYFDSSRVGVYIHGAMGQIRPHWENIYLQSLRKSAVDGKGGTGSLTLEPTDYQYHGFLIKSIVDFSNCVADNFSGHGFRIYGSVGEFDLGTITGGTGYTNGTYTNVWLENQTLNSSAKATIVVSGGHVTSVTITTQGNNYLDGDVLHLWNDPSQPAGLLAGSGFSVPILSAPSNASAATFTNCESKVNNGAGVYISGPDANQIIWTGGTIRLNTMVGIWDNSYLGNQFYGVHGNTNGYYSGAGWGHFRGGTNVNSATSFISCYGESQPSSSYVGIKAILEGGIHEDGVIGPGYIRYNTQSRHETVSPYLNPAFNLGITSSNITETGLPSTLGLHMETNGGAFWDLISQDSTSPKLSWIVQNSNQYAWELSPIHTTTNKFYYSINTRGTRYLHGVSSHSFNQLFIGGKFFTKAPLNDLPGLGYHEGDIIYNSDFDGTNPEYRINIVPGMAGSGAPTSYTEGLTCRGHGDINWELSGPTSVLKPGDVITVNGVSSKIVYIFQDVDTKWYAKCTKALPNDATFYSISYSTSPQFMAMGRGVGTTSQMATVASALQTIDKGWPFFNTDDSTTYFWSGYQFRAGSTGAVSGWGLTGNSGTDQNTNFVGTTDNQQFRVKVNNNLASYWDTDASLNVGDSINHVKIYNGGAGVSPSYSNTGGTGSRTSTITVTTDLTIADGNITMLVNGSFSNELSWASQAVSGHYIKYDFGPGANKLITEAKFYQQTGADEGTWKWQQSDDNSTWTDIGTSFAFGNATTQTITALSGNTTGHRYYRMLGVSGSVSSSPWIYEMEFKVGTPTSAPFTAIDRSDTTLKIQPSGKATEFGGPVKLSSYTSGNFVSDDTTADKPLVIDADGNIKRSHWHGGSSSTGGVQTLNVQYTDASNSGSTETDLYTFSVPANTLTGSGEYLVAEYDGLFNTPTSAVIKFYLNGSVSVFTGVSAVQRWHLKVKIIRTGTTTARHVAMLTGDFNNQIGELINDATGIDWTGSNTIKITGQDASSAQITAKMATVEYHPYTP